MLKENADNNFHLMVLQCYTYLVGNLSIHAYVKEKACRINLYTCNLITEFKEALDIVNRCFKQPPYIIKKKWSVK